MAKTAFTPKEQAFIREYLVDLNATQAAIRAGYSAKTAHVTGSKLLRNAKVAAAIAESIQDRFTRLDITADTLLARAATVMQTDVRQLTSHHIGACRHCHGFDFAYQWRTSREYHEALRAYERKSEAAQEREEPPSDHGGYGYRRTARPNPKCPECDGLGEPYVVFADTRDLSPEAAVLFEGVEKTREGLKFLLASKQAAFDTLAKYHGVATQKHEHTGANGKPIEHTVKVVVVPAKVPSPSSTRPMTDDEDDET